MKMVSLTLLVSTFCVLALAEQTPKIEFEQTVYDFGNISQIEAVTGTFKFKNVGEGVLKLQQPTSSCGSTSLH